MNSVEMLDYNNDGLYSQWEILEELPRPMHSAALVSSPQCKSLTLLGMISHKKVINNNFWSQA